jgi:hypothetical protein
VTYYEDMSREQLLAMCKRWERAAGAAGICGSEYYADPERVFERVRARQAAFHQALLRAKGVGAPSRGDAETAV